MKTLIVEDDFTCRLLLQEILKAYGPVHVAVNGREAVEAVKAGFESRQPYDLICLDLMMPEMGGYEALDQIRNAENVWGIKPSQGVKVVVTTALDRLEHVSQAFRGLCDAYLVKPIEKAALVAQLRELGLV